MKRFLFCLFAGTFSLTAQAAIAGVLTWADLELGHSYTLMPKVTLKPGLLLGAGTKMKLVDQVPLGQVQVVLFQFKLADCTGTIAGQKSEIIIVNKKYGIELEHNCVVNAYVELKDFYLPSLMAATRMLE